MQAARERKFNKPTRLATKEPSVHKKWIVGSLFPRLRAINYLSSFRLLKDFTEKYPCPELHDRIEAHQFVNELFHGEAVTYLEFGVWKGETMKLWCELNQNPASRFYGFDSFEGLPEDWVHFFSTTRAREFSTAGRLPVIKDTRVEFVKGWFLDTVNPFLKSGALRGRKNFVIHLDADLYSSTLYVLTKFDFLIESGENLILIFDEFSGVVHEFRAFIDYLSAYGRKIEPLANVNYYTNFTVRVSR